MFKIPVFFGFYRAPELFMGNHFPPYKYNQKIDIWGAGVMLCFCLTGRTPFDERGLAPLIERVNRAELFDDSDESHENSLSGNYMTVTRGSRGDTHEDEDFDLRFARLIVEASHQEERERHDSTSNETDESCSEIWDCGNSEEIHSFEDAHPGSGDREEDEPNDEEIEEAYDKCMKSKQTIICPATGICSPASVDTRSVKSCAVATRSLDLTSCSLASVSMVIPRTKSMRRQPTSLFGRGYLRLAIDKKEEVDNSDEPESDSICEVQQMHRKSHETNRPCVVRCYSMPAQSTFKKVAVLRSPLRPRTAVSAVYALKQQTVIQLQTDKMKTVKLDSSLSTLSCSGESGKKPDDSNESPASVPRRPRSKSVFWERRKPAVEAGRRRRPSKEFYRLRFDMDGEEWAHVSPEAKDMVRLLLTLDPAKRPSAADVLKHPWFTNNRLPDPTHSTHFEESYDSECRESQTKQQSISKMINKLDD